MDLPGWKDGISRVYRSRQLSPMVKLIGTAGHVDHGKTSLIRALTGIDADRLPEEKARGMTIDIGFAFLDLPKHGRVSIVDVPGHEKFLSNMLVGAGAVRVGLLCVAADEAVKPQTREHFEILELLPVERLVVAMTRCDLADDDQALFVQLEVESLLLGTRFEGSPIIRTSAVTGEGLAPLRQALEDALDLVKPEASGLWYLPVDRVFTVKGHGCVVTGTLTRGNAKVGETAVLLPGGSEARIRSIQVHGEDVEEASQGRRIALNLGGISHEEVQRGQILGPQGAVFETELFDAEIRWILEPKHGLRVRVAVGTEEAFGRLSLPREEGGLAQIRLETPIACALEQPVIIRRYSPPDLLGGGLIRIPVAEPRTRRTAIQGVKADSPSQAVLDLLSEKSQGLSTDDICRSLGKSVQEMGPVFEELLAKGEVLGFAGQWYGLAEFEAARDRFLSRLAELHEQAPGVGYQPREKAARAAGLKWEGKLFDRIVAKLASDQLIEANGTLVRRSDFRVQLTPRQRDLLNRAILKLQETPVNVPTHGELANAMGVPIQAVDEIFKLGHQAGETVTVSQGLSYSVQQISDLAARIREGFGDKGFTPAEFRDLLGSSRKYVIPLLEYLDSHRITLRNGDQRFLR